MEKITNLLKSFKGGGTREVAKDLPLNPYRDWLIIFIVGIVMFSIVAIYGAYLYWNVNNGMLVVVPPVEAKPVAHFNRGYVDSVLDKFDKKKEIFEQIKTDKTQFSDPSF